MITSTTENTYDFSGLSTDTKPTKAEATTKGKFFNIGNGSSFVEIDTGKIFLYDQENDQWVDSFNK